MQRKKKKKIKIFTIILIVIAIYSFFTLVEQQREINDLKMQKSDYLEKIQQVEKEIINTSNSLVNAKSNEYIEKMAREKLKMIHSDEVIFIDIGKTEN